MRTFSPKQNELNHDWFIIDASGKTLGRMATEIAHRLRGKHKPEYAPHMDNGDYVVVINAEKVKVTGNKGAIKFIILIRDILVGLNQFRLTNFLKKHQKEQFNLPLKVCFQRILWASDVQKIKVYSGSEHPHVAQQLKL